MNVKIDHPHNDSLNRLKDIWKITFADSDDYVDMVFDNYFESEYCLCAYDADNIVAFLMGIPYEFLINNNRIRALYLCGLSTDPKYRRHGIMQSMMRQMEKECAESDFKFTFLIPADDHLRSYYKRSGYLNSNPIIKYKITNNSVDKILNNIKLLPVSDEHMSECETNVRSNFDVQIGEIRVLLEGDISSAICNHDLEKIIDSCVNAERSSVSPTILHSRRDWRLIFSDKLRDGSALVYHTSNGNPDVVDCCFILQPDGELWILSGDELQVQTILNFIIKLGGDDSKLKGENNELKCESHLYGMVKFIDSDFAENVRIFKGSENPIFQNERVSFQKYQKMNFDDFGADSITYPVSDSSSNSTCEYADTDVSEEIVDISFRLMLD